MSSTRRIAAAGFALAITGTFIAVPAQADAATSSARVVAKAATSASTSSADDSVQSGYKSFSSTAKTPGRTTVSSARSLSGQAKAAAVSSSSPVVYVKTGDCSHDDGDGTQDNPYCSLQDGVNAAVSGDTVDVEQVQDEQLAYDQTVDVQNRTNLTIVGVGDGVGVGIGDAPPATWALYVENSSNITVRNMVFDGGIGLAAEVVESQNVTLDGDYFVNSGASTNTTLDVGDSADVTVSRSSIANNGGGIGVEVDDSSSNVVLASDIVSGGEFGVYAPGSAGLDVVGNTIQDECAGEVVVSGTSSDVSVENNVFEPPTASAATCTADEAENVGDVLLDPASGSTLTTDYNDFIFGDQGTAAYNWGGTTYATLAAFQAAVPQGAHDAVDPTVEAKMFVTPAGVNGGGVSMTMDAQPVSTSLSIGTANTAAPGALSTDYFGQGSYTDRGAIEYEAPALDADLTVDQTGARTVEANAEGSVARNTYATYTYSWGDGTTTASTTDAIVTHVYAHPGTYSVSVTVTDVFGDTSTATVSTPTSGSDYVPVTPTRILDTRKGLGTGGKVAAIGAGKTLALTVGGVGSVPAGVTAVAVNITATDATAGGHINAYPAGAAVPASSNLDFTQGKNVANMAVIRSRMSRLS
ncbi:right-handed parallel beta-helix repeat-containing protein [Actinospica durhamensis]|uniref:Right-handed parallel beta-helix repeat-containing protein n=1 Tax=Actinospica durhamensis TaxID=1508375 RepID=A0A941F1K8_9ACTN|nr:right-handed parallel beta-helix repeat-containing protein [Actinospica durhamensis]MBR7839464.1 right-handed parallel beta-helix repeat-containing protein [Actinospica durhamensis]